jgi:protein kinase-like protein
MSADRVDRDRLIELIAEGHEIDWEPLLSECGDATERALLDHLRVVAALTRATLSPAVPIPPSGASAILDPEISRVWGTLALREEIGRGAYGRVFRAWDTRLDRDVAVKFIDGQDPSTSLAEARRLARVVHRNIVSVFGADEIEGRFGLWMELLHGRTLDAIVRDQGPFSAKEAVIIALDICGAVAAIHRAGLVHRDIKAQNVMREYGGRHVLMDLGASVDASRDDVHVTSLAGTPLYMAPELFEGAPASISSDIYAMGVLLYRLVTADFPVHADTLGDVRRAHLAGGLRPLRDVRGDLPAAFIEVVERCIASDPRQRFTDVGALERALRGNDQAARPLDRWRIAWLTGTLGLVAGLALAGWAYWMSGRTASSPAAAAPEGMSEAQYRLFAGYQELAFASRLSDPAASATALGNALSMTRLTFPGNQPLFALLFGQVSNSLRHAGDLAQAEANARDAMTNMYYSVGDEHPFTTAIAMELARNAQAHGDVRLAAEQVLRALTIRQQILGVQADAGRLVQPTLSALESSMRTMSVETDSDGDGLLDAIEAAVGLNPRSIDSDGDGVSDDDETVGGTLKISNLLKFGLAASPYLTWAHYGASQPRYEGWQTPQRFPMIERGELRPPRWRIAAKQGQGYFTQRLSREQSQQAIQRGFSLFIRVQPIYGLAGVTVDTSPVGPRFDVTLQRTSDRTIELAVLSSVVPLQVAHRVSIEATQSSVGPLIELRYQPRTGSAAVFLDGRREIDGYVGHRQFQDPLEGGVAWAVSSPGNVDRRPECSYSLVWLEIH